MPKPAAQVLLERYWEEVNNLGKLELIRELCSDPITRHDPGGVTVLNAEPSHSTIEAPPLCATQRIRVPGIAPSCGSVPTPVRVKATGCPLNAPYGSAWNVVVMRALGASSPGGSSS